MCQKKEKGNLNAKQLNHANPNGMPRLGRSTLYAEAHQMFSNHITLKKFDKKKATISGHFGFVFEENTIKEIT